MAHWGIAMTYFHQLWDPSLSPGAIPAAQREIHLAQQISAGSERERKFINALASLYQDAGTVAYRPRALSYERAMSDLAAENRKQRRLSLSAKLQTWRSYSFRENHHRAPQSVDIWTSVLVVGIPAPGYECSRPLFASLINPLVWQSCCLF
jgi:hypothetical protein